MVMMVKGKLTELSTLYLKSRYDVSKKTLRSISHTIESFIEWIPNDRENITFDDYQLWSDTLNVAIGTKAGYQCKLREFIDFVNSHGMSLPRPTVIKTRDNYSPYLFKDDDYERIVGLLDNYVYTNSRSLNEKYVISMVVRILISTGLRINEVCHLTLADYDSKDELLHIKKAKNKKERLVPIHNSLAKIMNRYIDKMGIRKETDYLFPLKDHSKHIEKQQIEMTLRIIFKRCGFKRPDVKYQRGVCPHCFRHTFAISSFRKSISEGKDITDIVPYLSIYMGHHSLSETEKYLKFSTDLFPDSLDMFDDYSADLFEV